MTAVGHSEFEMPVPHPCKQSGDQRRGLAWRHNFGSPQCSVGITHNVISWFPRFYHHPLNSPFPTGAGPHIGSYPMIPTPRQGEVRSHPSQ